MVMGFISKGFSYMMFWGENFIFVIFFIAFEICLMPFVWFICFCNIIYSTPGMFTTFFNLIKWCILGILYMTFILLKDVWNLLKILAMHRGCKEYVGLDKSLSPEEILKKNDLKINCYNQIRAIVIQMY
jgi:hypothetical protein